MPGAGAFPAPLPFNLWFAWRANLIRERAYDRIKIRQVGMSCWRNRYPCGQPPIDGVVDRRVVPCHRGNIDIQLKKYASYNTHQRSSECLKVGYVLNLAFVSIRVQSEKQRDNIRSVAEIEHRIGYGSKRFENLTWVEPVKRRQAVNICVNFCWPRFVLLLQPVGCHHKGRDTQSCVRFITLGLNMSDCMVEKNRTNWPVKPIALDGTRA